MFKNEVYEHKQSGQQVRVLEMDGSTRTVWLFDVANPKALPFGKPVEAFRDAIDDGQFVLVAGTSGSTVKTPSEAALARRNEAYDSIEPLVKTMDIFDPSCRSALVKSRAQALGCSEQTLYARLRAWWRGGQSRQALTPKFHCIGSKAGATANRGRPPAYASYPIYQMGERDHDAIRAVLKRQYMASEVATLDGAYQTLLETHYAYVDGEGQRVIRERGERPSSQQFLYFARKSLPREARIRSRKGNVYFELNERPKLGSLRHQTHTVGDVYEIDSTVADVFLVHPEDRSKIIGKPTLYMVRDRKSNLVVGFYVGLENPCWLAAMHAIKSITEDKAELCRRYGLPYSPADWPAHGAFPKAFVADRGPEMVSGASEQLAEGLEVDVINLPTGRADWKPHVECGFKQTQRPLANVVPGYQPPENFGKRQTKDHSQSAALTLHEFTRSVLAAIIRSNRNPIKDYPLAPAYVLAGMQPTPLNIWNAEIRDRAGLLTRYSEEQVRLALLPRAEATVTPEGIWFGDCFYSAPEALEKGWFVEARRGRFRVNVAYDRRLTDAIYVYDDRDRAQVFVATLLDKCSHYRGRSFAEVESLAYLRKLIQHDSEQLTRQLKSDLHGYLKPMVAQAVKETKMATQGKSRTSRKKQTVVAREDARLRQRQVEARIEPSGVQGEGPLARLSRNQPLQDALATGPLASIPAAPTSNVPTTSAPKSRQQKYQELLDGL